MMEPDEEQKTQTIRIPPEVLRSPPPAEPSNSEPITLPATEDRLPVSTPAPPDRPTLRVVTGPQMGSVFALEKDVVVIGRGRDCDVRLDDLGVSRRHARVLREGDDFFVEDLGSRNGTFVQDTRVTRRMLADGLRIGIGPTVMLRFSYIDELEEGMLRRLYESAVLDALTGAHNRKYFDERLAAELAYASRHKTEISLILFDIDHFKHINDTFGHLAGDGVLRTIVGLVRKALRAEDVLARIGGEEFAIIARGIDGRRARSLGERVRALVERAKFDVGSAVLRVTVSVGVASLGCVGTEAEGRDLVELADRRLYRAKESGRNSTVGPLDEPRS